MPKDKDNDGALLDDDGRARSVAVLITELDAGQFHRDLNHDLRRLNRDISHLIDQGMDKVKGKLTITLTLTGRRNGAVHILSDSKLATPKVPRVETVRYLNREGNLEKDDPRQEKLPLRDVSVEIKKPRDVGAAKD